MMKSLNGFVIWGEHIHAGSLWRQLFYFLVNTRVEIPSFLRTRLFSVKFIRHTSLRELFPLVWNLFSKLFQLTNLSTWAQQVFCGNFYCLYNGSFCCENLIEMQRDELILMRIEAFVAIVLMYSTFSMKDFLENAKTFKECESKGK